MGSSHVVGIPDNTFILSLFLYLEFVRLNLQVSFVEESPWLHSSPLSSFLPSSSSSAASQTLVFPSTFTFTAPTPIHSQTIPILTKTNGTPKTPTPNLNPKIPTQTQTLTLTQCKILNLFPSQFSILTLAIPETRWRSPHAWTRESRVNAPRTHCHVPEWDTWHAAGPDSGWWNPPCFASVAWAWRGGFLPVTNASTTLTPASSEGSASSWIASSFYSSYTF